MIESLVSLTPKFRSVTLKAGLT